jgi:FkbM family methyltransferase
MIQTLKTIIKRAIYKNKDLSFHGAGEYLNIVNIFNISLEKNPTIVEVGSLDCMDAILIQKKFSNAKVYSFEANPKQIPLMEQNAKKNACDISIINNAVSESNSKIDFYYSGEGNPGASSIYQMSKSEEAIEHTLSHTQEKMSVESIRLETWMNKEGINKIDLLMLDTQGSELDVLKSLGKKIKNVNHIILEGQYVALYEDTPLIYEINDYLINEGFTLESNNLKRILRKRFNNFYYKNLNL